MELEGAENATSSFSEVLTVGIVHTLRIGVKITFCEMSTQRNKRKTKKKVF